MKKKISQNTLSKMVQVGLFEAPPDKVLKAGALANVFTGEVQEKVYIGIFKERIAYVVGWDHPLTIGDQTEVIDLGDYVLCPGFIDGHTHVDGWMTLGEFLKYAIPGGATAIVTETSAIASAMGKRGVLALLRDAARQPIPVFVTAPPEIPPYPKLETCHPFDVSDYAEILAHEKTLGMGEVYWNAVIKRERDLLRKMAMTLEMGKVVEGHAAGARNDRLDAYIATGVSSCHESITPEEVFEKRRLGMDVMVRCGYIRDDLAAIAPALRGKATDGIMLVSDNYSPKMLVQDGYLNHIAQLAVERGLEPVDVVKMLSLNVARHFRLDRRGGIAPGWFADIIAVKDLRNFEVEFVMSEGGTVWKEGTFLMEPKPCNFPKSYRKSIKIPEAHEIDFYLWGKKDPTEVRVIEVKTETVTNLFTASLSLSEEGNIQADPDRDILKLSVIYRGATSYPEVVGFVRGFGLKQGAVATSLSWDCNNIVVLGPNECDMAAAVNRVIELGGGMVFSLGEEVVVEVPLPLAGITSDKALTDLACEINEFEITMHDMGCPLPRPFLVLQTLPFTGLPFYRLTDKGLLDIRAKKLIPVIIS
ncbi:MAG: hypothetical protein DSY91_07525 [Deltaproteobacteria bacterium]|nr:MAG: hypothetical protein DSY91_07525 [Deltaproteobacteria bacterium]